MHNLVGLFLDIAQPIEWSLYVQNVEYRGGAFEYWSCRCVTDCDFSASQRDRVQFVRSLMGGIILGLNSRTYHPGLVSEDVQMRLLASRYKSASIPIDFSYPAVTE